MTPGALEKGQATTTSRQGYPYQPEPEPTPISYPYYRYRYYYYFKNTFIHFIPSENLDMEYEFATIHRSDHYTKSYILRRAANGYNNIESTLYRD